MTLQWLSRKLNGDRYGLPGDHVLLITPGLVGDKLHPHVQLRVYAHDLRRPLGDIVLDIRRPPNDRPRWATALFRPLP